MANRYARIGQYPKRVEKLVYLEAGYDWSAPVFFKAFGEILAASASVYDAVNAAGMSIPFPQREMRLLRDPVPDSNADIVKPAAKLSARPDEKDKSA